MTLTTPDASGVPAHCRLGIIGHVLDGRPVGFFLNAVLAGRLSFAATRADAANVPALAHYGVLLTHWLPSLAWGSEERVEAWRDRRGREGRFRGAEWPPTWEEDVDAYLAAHPFEPLGKPMVGPGGAA